MRKLFRRLVMTIIVIVLSTTFVMAQDSTESWHDVYKNSKFRAYGAKASDYYISSSNKKVIKVYRSGKLYAKKVGSANVVLVNKSDGSKRICHYRVVKRVKKIKISWKPKTVFSGEYVKLKAKTTPRKNAERIYWKSSNNKIATVNSSGVVTVKAKGSVKITAYTYKNKRKASVKINCKLSPKFNEGVEKEVEVGDEFAMSIPGYSNNKFNWSSNNTMCVSVNSRGVVIAKHPGKADITAKGPDGKTARCTIVVRCTDGLTTEGMLVDNNINECKKLAIVAHPDDETLWGGASLMSGDWFVVCLTNGNKSYRSDEFREVLRRSGNNGIILSYPDDSYKGIRDDWTYCTSGIQQDLTRIIDMHDWEQIVTYNPDGVTGHMHHKLTCNIVNQICYKTGTFEKLWYYGHFYNKGMIPDNLNRIDDSLLAFKQQLVKIYQREAVPISLYWEQMIPYEVWINATDWGNPKTDNNEVAVESRGKESDEAITNDASIEDSNDNSGFIESNMDSNQQDCVNGKDVVPLEGDGVENIYIENN